MSILKYHAHAKHQVSRRQYFSRHAKWNTKFIFRDKTQSASKRNRERLKSYPSILRLMSFLSVLDNEMYQGSLFTFAMRNILSLITSIIQSINYTLKNVLQSIRHVVNDKIICTLFKNKF